MSSSFSPWPHSPLIANDRNKRPRHRHTPSQLAALNNLYDTTEHPTLDLRSDLAERLGMETKTVNAWFQNKRASAKRRSRGAPPYDLPHHHHSSASSSLVHTPSHDDYHDPDFVPYDSHRQRSALAPPSSNPGHRHHPGDTHFFTESDSMPRKMRIRPTAQQTEALKKFYKLNPHPSKEDREELGDRIGMRYQSITNWFQNQRSLAKKRNEDAEAADTSINKKSNIPSHESRTFAAFPPPSNHPSLSLSLNPHRSRAALPSPIDAHSSRASTPASASAPNSSLSQSLSRPRRTRPEPYQLDALKELFTRTSNPSIEERSALALEIGMDLGKVTNWFRNLRQTARKRAKKGDDDDEDDDGNIHSSPGSRLGTPSFRSSSSSSAIEHEDQMDLDDNYHQPTRHRRYHHTHSDPSDDERYDDLPPSTPPPIVTRHRVVWNPATDRPEYDKAHAARFSDVKLDDALLLLSFHHHIAQPKPVSPN